MNNLKQFATAFSMYASDYFERYPDSTDGLVYMESGHEGEAGYGTIYPDYISTARTFWCPSDYTDEPPTIIDNDDENEEDSCQISYAYAFGLRVAHAAYCPIMSDAGVNNHQGNGGNVLYLDGSVRWVKGGEDEDKDEWVPAAAVWADGMNALDESVSDTSGWPTD
ncbi:unnamed protein product [marine sediment metagenome]|uniref:Uncharacterized protein n=1 Tax=marine sediment metagenome TaxID=412755 RepID=X1NC57_9ZZZZ